MNLLFRAITVCLLLAVAPMQCKADIIFTENFESGIGGFTSGIGGELLDSATYTDPAVTAQIGSQFVSFYNLHERSASLAEVFEVGTRYDFQFSNFRRDFGVIGGRSITAQIGYNNGLFNVLESQVFAAVSDVTTVETRSLSFTSLAGGAELGENIVVRFFSDPGEANNAFQAGIDNVQVSATSVPEPSAACLTLVGFAATGLLRRRRR